MHLRGLAEWKQAQKATSNAANANANAATTVPTESTKGGQLVWTFINADARAPDFLESPFEFPKRIPRRL